MRVQWRLGINRDFSVCLCGSSQKWTHLRNAQSYGHVTEITKAARRVTMSTQFVHTNDADDMCVSISYQSNNIPLVKGHLQYDSMYQLVITQRLGLLFFFFCFFETGPHYVTQAGLEPGTF